MPDSNSDLSDATPPDDATIESTLHRIVRDAIKKDEEITVRIARARAEEQLGLPQNWFKEDLWKDRSKDIINAAVEAPDSPVKEKEKPKAGRKRKSEEPAGKPKKKARKSPVVESDEDEEDVVEDEEEDEVKPKPKPRAKPQRKQPAKKSPVIESDDEEDEEEEEQEKAKPKRKTKSKTSTPIVNSEDEEDEADEADVMADTDAENKPAPKESQSPAKDTQPNAEPTKEAATAAGSDNDSDLSSLIDEPPRKKKAGRPKKATSPSTTSSSKPTAAKKSSTTTSSKPAPTADEEEIKRLQSQLLKCGIRKLWHRELAPFDTARAKIAHLRSMLHDAGMTGRFSAEKAKAIKEARELEAELEAARDFEEKWGTGGRGRRAKREVSLKEDVASEDEGEGEDDEARQGGGEEVKKRPGGRLLPKGLVDFGDSGDDESD